jgi:hypothetical protein
MECSALDITCHFGNLVDMIQEFFLWIWEQILSAMVAVLSLIPVPSWMASGSFSLPDGVLWFAQALELDYGASVMVAAWLIRFGIRRLPIIG